MHSSVKIFVVVTVLSSMDSYGRHDLILVFTIENLGLSVTYSCIFPPLVTCTSVLHYVLHHVLPLHCTTRSPTLDQVVMGLQ